MVVGKTSDNVLSRPVEEIDVEIVSAIYYKYADSLFRYGLKFTNDVKIVEDCLQDLFLEIISKHQTLLFHDNLRFYLFRSFRNNLLRLLSREKRFLTRPPEDVFSVLFRIEENSVEDEVASEKIETLRCALENLSVRQREAVYLRFRNGLEYEEIAKMMNMEIESCRNTIYRAIKSLRKQLIISFFCFFRFKKASC